MSKKAVCAGCAREDPPGWKAAVRPAIEKEDV